MNMNTTPNASWLDRAAAVIASSPNDDWKKFSYTMVPGEIDLPLEAYNSDDKLVPIGNAKAVVFTWSKPTDAKDVSFVGFIVAVFNGTIMGATPIINMSGKLGAYSDEMFYSTANDITRRRCPKCETFDTITYGRRVRTCTRKCGFKESMI